MSLTTFWAIFQERYPFIATYCLAGLIAVIGVLFIFIFTHGQTRIGVDEDMKRIACIHAYGHYDADRDICVIRN